MIDKRKRVPFVMAYTKTGPYLLTDEILSISVIKDKDDMAGSFTFTLRDVPQRPVKTGPAYTWDAILHNMSVVQIGTTEWYADKSGRRRMKLGSEEYEMTGFIRDRMESNVMSGKSPASSVKFMGSDMGGLFMIYQIIYNAWLPADHAIIGAKATGLTFYGTPDSVIKDVLRTYLYDPDKGLRFGLMGPLAPGQIGEWSKIKTWIDTETKILKATLKNSLVSDLAVLQSQGPLINAMQMFSEKPFFEMFVETDTQTGKCYLIFRPAPYGPKMWEKGKTLAVNISDSDVLEKTVTQSDKEAKNYFFVNPTAYVYGQVDPKGFIQPVLIDYLAISGKSAERTQRSAYKLPLGGQTLEEFAISRGIKTEKEWDDMARRSGIYILPKKVQKSITVSTGQVRIVATKYDTTEQTYVKAPPLPVPRYNIHMYAPIEEYGIRTLEVDTKFIRVMDVQKTASNNDKEKQDSKSTALLLAARMEMTLAQWFCMNHTYKSGTIRIKSNSQIKIGKYVKIKDRKTGRFQFYYVKSRRLDWSFGQPNMVTTLGVIRGVEETIIMPGEKDINYTDALKEIANMVSNGYPAQEVRNAGLMPLGEEYDDDTMTKCFAY